MGIDLVALSSSLHIYHHFLQTQQKWKQTDDLQDGSCLPKDAHYDIGGICKSTTSVTGQASTSESCPAVVQYSTDGLSQ